MVTWEDDDKINGIPHLADIPYYIGKDYLVIVMLYQPELDASKKAATDNGIQYLPLDGPPQWLLSLVKANMTDNP